MILRQPNEKACPFRLLKNVSYWNKNSADFCFKNILIVSGDNNIITKKNKNRRFRLIFIKNTEKQRY